MSASRIAPVIAVLALMVACQDEPTAVKEIDSLEPQLINTEEGNWVELPPRIPWTSNDYVPCVNEVLRCQGTTVTYTREHSPPAGDNSIMNGMCTYTADTYCIGEESGVRWNLDKMNCHIQFLTKQSDGREYWTGNTTEHYLTEAGDKLHMNGLWWYVWNPFPNLESFRFQSSCGPSK